MFELIYCSKGIKGLDYKEITSILGRSRSFNTQNDVTGCLLYYNNEFLQLIEGEKETILDLYDQICEDKRHYDLVLLGTGTKEKRLFSSWSMLFNEPNNDDVIELEGKVPESRILSKLTQEPSTLASKLLFSYLNQKWKWSEQPEYFLVGKNQKK